ncbi:MAG: NADH-quinone oxidoreductase subunit L [Vicinamibacteraceae bacterium]|nr:NADH-quinone oxidoreductase subunit L [Vicinamibacteraceae bacterium]
MLLLIPLFPLVGFLVNAFVGRRLPKTVSGWTACLAMFASLVAAAAAAWQIFSAPVEARLVEQTVYTWIASGDFEIPLTLRLDPLGTVMALVVTGIGFLIHVYSLAYMHEETEREYARYFSYMNLFAFFMLVLVLGANFLVMFVGWEGVGLCSYLLIGFWFKKQSANDAGKKAFVVNRVGDFAFIVGMMLLFREFGTLDFREVALHAATLSPEVSFGLISLTTLLFFIGATGKSAQIPLYVWLPDAMEGPTPVSALIHAATMVTAGVYMIGRNAELFSLAPDTLQIVAVVGVVTALFAGTIGLVQNDIKRVLAYSTVSQLGFMFLAMGVGAFSAGIFHLYTHAFFKALMFLGSGAVIHALHGEQDMRRMGGLRRALPITYWTFLAGALAIVGFPLLSGFFSKDEILFRTFYGGHELLWTIGALTSLLTAIYMFRLVYMTFHGEPRYEVAGAHGHDAHGHAHGAHLHDAPPSMAIPLVLLAVGSILAGYVGVPHALGGHNRIETFLEPSFHPAAHARVLTLGPGEGGEFTVAHGTETAADEAGHAAASHTAADAHAAEEAKTRLELTLMSVSVLIALAGIGIATFFFLRRPDRAAAMAASMPGLHRLLLNKYYVDEAYDAAIVRPVQRLSEDVLWKGVDVRVVDGAVNGAGSLVSGTASLLRLLQTGSVRAYAAWLFVGVLALVGYYLVW